ncbi:MAG: hypothetical protein JWN15_3085, partial [Firmicutes bacterium]|nr:hypothetical protein [Bacillota bacterium]
MKKMGRSPELEASHLRMILLPCRHRAKLDPHPAAHLVGEAGRCGVSAQITRADTGGDGLEAGFTNGLAGTLVRLLRHLLEQGG